MNSHSGYLHTTPTLNHLLRILENGRLLYSSRYVLFVIQSRSKKKITRYNYFLFRLTIKAHCSMSLGSFPLDVQTCSLMFSSCKLK
jgi:hypothetical protein